MKKILSIPLTALVLLTIAVSCAQDVTVDAQLYNKVDTEVFMLNGKYYATLQEAVNARLGKGAKAAGDNDGVIYLRKNAAGPGAVINDPNTPVTIDFAGYTYSFKDVTATEGSTTGTFGLSISGGSEVTLKGTSTMTLFDSTANLTMVYVSGSNSSLVIEDAPKMEVKENQYVFWATDGATLTIGKSSEDAARVSGGIAVTGTTISIKGNSVVAGAVKATDNATVFIESASTASVITNLNVGDSSKVVVSKGKVTLEEKEEGQIEVIGEGTVVNETGDASAVDDTNIGKNTIINGDWNTLYKLQEALISENFGKTITLVADVDLSGVAWTPVGTFDNPFSGIFDGNDKAIKNLAVSNDKQIGLFKYAKNATFKNIRFENASITDAVEDGAVLLGYAFGNLTIDNVVIDSDSEVSGTKKVGGLVGTIDNRLDNGGKTYITNCTNSASITSGSRIGALVANIYCWNTQGDDLSNNSFDDGHLYYFENCTNTGLLTETGTGTSGVGLVSYINQGTRYGGYTETYLMQETFVFKNCNNDYEKMSITKEDGNKGYYIGTYTNAGRIVIEKNGESYSNRIVGGLSSGRYIFKVNNDLYGFRSETADDGAHLPLSIENSPVDLGLVISRVNQQEAIDYFLETSGYPICYIDEGKVYPINANTASFDDNYDLLIEGGFLVIGNSYYSITVEPFVKTGKTVKVTHSEQSTSEYTYQILDTVN